MTDLQMPPAASAPPEGAGIVGHSARMRAVFEFVRVIAESDSNVLITGETGTGKETIATLIHASGRRRDKPFVPVSCAILTESLIESELFGHERGAFTGAFRERAGRFEMADGGTIFLDDVDDVAPSIQVKLLRVIQGRVIERVGGVRGIPVDVRIIAGSKRSLRRLVGEGLFRADLYHRLNVLPIWLPPLRQRREDIPVLTDHFLRRFFAARGRIPEVSPAVREVLQRYAWPGNVRELENACERIAQTCHCARVRCACLPAPVLLQGGATLLEPPACSDRQSSAVDLDARLREVESQLITWALKVSGGNKSKAAETLQMRRSTLGDRIARLGLEVPGEDP